MSPVSALPDFYYAVFALFEPFISALGFIGTLVDPKTVRPTVIETDLVLIVFFSTGS
jgi:hypothetical protein